MKTFGDLMGRERISCGPAPKNRFYPLTNQGVGVELEYTQALGAGCPPGWESKPDGSIKGEMGVEFTFYDAAKGPDINRRLKAMDQVLRDKPENFIPDQTCATHVHLDMSDFPVDRFVNLVEAIFITEPYLFWWADWDRRGNIFSIPWAHSVRPSDVSTLNHYFSQGAPHDRSVNSKYSAVNIQPLANPAMCTVEFRHLPSTRSMARVRKWIGMCMHVKRLALLDEDILEGAQKGGAKFLFGRLASEFKRCDVDVSAPLFMVRAIRSTISNQQKETAEHAVEEDVFAEATTPRLELNDGGYARRLFIQYRDADGQTEVVTDQG